MASVIVRMVHDLVRDAIADVIGKVASKVAIGVLTAGLAAPWAVASVTADVSSWVTRLSKEVTDTVTSARNLKGLLERARSLLDDVGAAFGRIPSTVTQVAARVGDDVAGAARQARDFLSSLRPQHALAGAPGTTMAQARQVGRARPTVHTPKNPTTPRPSRPNPNEGRWGQKLDETSTGAKGADDAADAARSSADGKPEAKPVDERADRGDGRDVRGRYADGNGGAHMYDQSEALGLEQYTETLKQRGEPVREVIEDKRLARIDGAPQGRYYDRIIQREDGTWVGLEVKSGDSPYAGGQRAADNMVSPDNPARVKLDDGRTIEITRVVTWRVPKQ